jgi:hypothetical protein
MKKKAKRYDNGGRTFSAEQEAWLGGADRTDPYILARMERAVPNKKAPVVDSVKPKTRAEVEAENAVPEVPKKDLSEIRSEDGSLSKLRRNTETGELYSPDEPITRSFAKSSSSKPKAPANPATKSAKSEATEKPTEKSAEKATAPARRLSREEMISSIPTDKNTVEGGERISGNEFTRNVGNTMNALAGVTGAGAANPAIRSAMNAGLYGRRSTQAGREAIANNPTRQLSGPSKADLMARDRAARSAERQTEMLRENARRSGLDPDNINADVANAIRQRMGGKDFSLGMKRGGAVKKMAKGGVTKSSSASSRGDGIASKGKTKGKIY